jgi:type IV secretion system protein VirB10
MTESATTTPVQIQEKAPKPQGLLPKNVQSWLLIGLAFLMVAIMWLTGGKKPPTPTKAVSPATTLPAPLEINETKIAEMQNRIEDLQRQQLAAQNALAQQTHLLGAAAQDPQQSQPQNGPAAPAGERPEDQIQTERKKRAYMSLFASNVALSYRKSLVSAVAPANETPTPTLLPAAPDAAQMAQLLKDMQPNPALSTTAASVPAPTRTHSAETTNDRKEEVKNPAAVPSGALNAAAGKTYVLFEGTILETVLINRLDGQFSGPIECLLSTDVYSNDRQHLLIPAGSKLLGETKKVEAFGQTRLAVAFHRILMPDGYSVSLDGFKGLNQIGDTGLRDQVNNHYLRIFGVSLAVGAIGAVAEAGTGSALTSSGTDLMRQGFAGSMAQSSSQILDRFLNVPPTITIREGHRVKVYLAGDLALPDYNSHKMPSDL